MEEKSTFEGKGVKGVANYYLTHTKDDKAITLVALIIIVIILLILAGVTISIALGENGIFSQSKLAVQKYENARMKEEKELQDVSNLISSLGVASNRDETKSNEEKIAELEAKVNSLTVLISENGGINPIGTIIAMYSKTEPNGYLKCDGGEYDISKYPELAELIKDTNGSYGSETEGKFKVPNLQGEFLRGTGKKGADVGVHQDGTGIPGIYQSPTAETPIIALRSDIGDLASDVFYHSNDDGTITAKSTVKVMNIKATTTGTSQAKSARYMVRPTNTSVLYCIKY